MDRFSGFVGIRTSAQETVPGIFIEEIVEYPVTGNVVRKPYRWSSGELSQEKVKANQIISILAPESDLDYFETVYVVWKQRKWTVVNIEYSRPRVIITIGSIYKGE